MNENRTYRLNLDPETRKAMNRLSANLERVAPGVLARIPGSLIVALAVFVFLAADAFLKRSVDYPLIDRGLITINSKLYVKLDDSLLEAVCQPAGYEAEQGRVQFVPEGQMDEGEVLDVEVEKPALDRRRGEKDDALRGGGAENGIERRVGGLDAD
ncbi:hypothetical protein [Deferrisoma camini]|uniref:hypothetical protein n=1 Tax=Deferrisoma camini TaxID=1035120 RepID=UPI0004B27EB8|nr:hypothetical protein [Deferrisoma camini]